jgi:WD40 repeat protein
MGLGMVGKVELRSTVDMELQAELRIGTPSISLIAFSPDGRWLAISGAEGKITPWRLRRWG